MAAIIEKYLPSVLLMIMSLGLAYQDRKRSKRAEDYEKHISGMFSQLITCITANNEGTLALARAQKNNDTNGGLTAAMAKIQGANERFEDFIRDLASSNLVKR